MCYSAWRAAGDDGVTALGFVGVDMAAWILPPYSFNVSLMAILAKGDDPLDNEEINRGAKDTRPSSLTQCSNKVVGGVWHDCMKPVLAKSACPIQRGS